MAELRTRSKIKRDAAGASLLKQIRANELTVLLVRHGQPGPGLEVDGLLGSPLTALGRRQAHRVGKRLAQVPLTQIYCSDMARSHQTAHIAAAYSPGIPIEISAQLREIPAFHQPGSPPIRTPEDEQLRQQQQEAAEQFVATLRNRHGMGDVVAIITHSGINRLLIAIMAGIPLKETIPAGADHTSVTVVSIADGNSVKLKMLNCTRHLPASMIATPNY